MKTKLFTFFVSLFATTCLWAYDFQSGDLYYNITNSSEPYTVEVTYGSSKCSGSVTIPETVTYNGTTYNVTSIGERAFDDCSALTSVTIPNSITSIGSYAFLGCEALTKTNYTGDVAGWCDFEFENFYSNPICYSHNFYINNQEIKDLVIPNTVDSIHYYAFYNCSALTSVRIPNSVKSIGYYAFYHCCFLKKDFINNSSLDAEKYNYWGALVGDTEVDGLIISGTTVVWGRKHLTDVTIPNYITNIGYYAFYNCSALTSVTISENVTSIEDYAFYNCSALTSVTIGENVTSIGDHAFHDCSALTSVTIPNSVTSIGIYAFNGCTSLTSIAIGNGVISIGYDAFTRTGLSKNETNWENDVLYIDNCLIDARNYDLESYIIKDNTRLIADNAFESCDFLTSVTIPSSVRSIGSCSFSMCSSLSSITIPNGVVNIGGMAFFECPITSVTIPNSVKSIGERPFRACSSLNSILVESGNSTYDSRNGCNAIIETATNTLIAGCQNTIIPNSVTSIGKRAFQGCSSLTTITIPNSVSNIGSEAFGGCSSLTSVFVESSTPPKCDNYSSFPQLPSLVCYIPCGTKELYKQTFPWDRLQISHYEEYSPLIYAGICGSNVTWEYNHGEISIQGTGQLIGDCMPWEPLIDSITSVNIANGITHIPENAFADCKKLTKITLPNSLEEIGKDAFANCRLLYDIYCYATMPPLAVESSFTNYNAYVYIPCESQRFYQADMVWSEFKNMQCISSDNVSTDGVVITPTTNDVTITWPTENNAETYTIVIKKGDEVFCNLTFNADGQLLNIAFAPARDGNNHGAQYAEQSVNGYRFTVTGLNEGICYTYNIDVKDAANKTIKSYSGEFITEALTAVENTYSQLPVGNIHKTIHNGQLLIVRDGKTYNAQGILIN